MDMHGNRIPDTRESEFGHAGPTKDRGSGLGIFVNRVALSFDTNYNGSKPDDAAIMAQVRLLASRALSPNALHPHLWWLRVLALFRGTANGRSIRTPQWLRSTIRFRAARMQCWSQIRTCATISSQSTTSFGERKTNYLSTPPVRPPRLSLVPLSGPFSFTVCMCR